MSDETRHDIQVTSIFGASTRKGLVQLTVDQGPPILMLPAKAREIAAFLLEAASGAEGDEALMAVLERQGQSLARQGQYLLSLRQERAIIDQRARLEARRQVAEDQSDPDRPH